MRRRQLVGLAAILVVALATLAGAYHFFFRVDKTGWSVWVGASTGTTRVFHADRFAVDVKLTWEHFEGHEYEASGAYEGRIPGQAPLRFSFRGPPNTSINFYLATLEGYCEVGRDARGESDGIGALNATTGDSGCLFTANLNRKVEDTDGWDIVWQGFFGQALALEGIAPEDLRFSFTSSRGHE